MKPFIRIGILLVVLLLIATSRADAQSGLRLARITALMDYAQAVVEFDGTVTTMDNNRPDLGAWGLTETRPAWKAEGSSTWSVHGTLNASRVITTEVKGTYRLQTGAITLAPQDTFYLLAPFVNIDYARVQPAPDNLADLITPGKLPAETPPGLVGMKFSGGAGRTINLDVPFTPIQKQISLSLIPLVGEMWLGRADSFRLLGRVRYGALGDFGEFTRHCKLDPASPLFRYRLADLLFSLDSPPTLSAGLLSSVYQFKPTSILLSVDPASCRFDGNTGFVEATFSGRVLAVQPNLARFPQAWLDADMPESNQEIQTRSGRHYELRFGEITLAPGDVLTITVPTAEIHDVSPAPTRFHYARGQSPEMIYEGPRRFALRVEYTPEAGLLLRQIPNAVRTLVKPFEFALRAFTDSRGASLTWGLLVAGLALVLARKRAQDQAARSILAGLGWVALGIALLYGLRGAFGLLILATLAYLDSLEPARRSAREWVRGIAMLALILLANWLDSQAEGVFTLLSTLELETTPITPTIMLALAIVLVGLFAFTRAKEEHLFPGAYMPMALALATLATFDVFQKSALCLLLFGLGIAFIRARASSAQANQDFGARLRIAWQSRLIPLGVGALILFAAQNSLQSTTAVIGASLGMWGAVLMPVLLFFSIVQGLLAVGVLFILIYSALPFKAGYLKALVYALFLLLIFVVGTGSDDRLISSFETLIVGRFIYYVSVPLLIGIYLDIVDFIETDFTTQTAAGKTPTKLTIAQAAPLFLKQIKGITGMVGSIASVVAPGAYAIFAGNPLVTTYFDVLEKLVTLSLGV